MDLIKYNNKITTYFFPLVLFILAKPVLNFLSIKVAVLQKGMKWACKALHVFNLLEQYHLFIFSFIHSLCSLMIFTLMNNEVTENCSSAICHNLSLWAAPLKSHILEGRVNNLEAQSWTTTTTIFYITYLQHIHQPM